MKIIHTGDWHIGKIVNEISMLEEQKYILEQLVSIIKKETPDAIIIAGDIFDRSIPPVEAIEMVDELFNKILLEMKIPILAVSGNHDSAERLSFGSKIMTNNGLHIEGVFNKEISCITLKDNFGPVNFYMVPYTDPRIVRNLLEEKDISTHDDAMKKIIGKVKKILNKNERNIMITHGYIAKIGEQPAHISESERPLSIGGTDFVSSEHFSVFNYTALGHLHAPQKAGANNIRYSGSLLKYSFSEVNQKKGVYLVEINELGEVETKFISLIPNRDMRIIMGPINELLKPEVYKDTNTEDYIYAILTDKGELIDPISKLRTVYPNIMGLTKENGVRREDSRTAANTGYKLKSKLELFKEFYNSIQGEDLSEEAIEIMSKVIGEVEKVEWK